jgi:hypothetical protein
MRVVAGMLVALLGAAVGAAIGVALTYALLSGEGVNGFVWLASGVFFCVPCTLGGAVATGLLCRGFLPGVFLSSRQRMGGGDRFGVGASVLYGIGASIVVLVVVPIAALDYSTRGASQSPGQSPTLSGDLCVKPGIRYDGTNAQGVRVCFTLSADRSKWVEIAWRFDSKSGCPGGSQSGWAGASSLDWGDTLADPGQIAEPGFKATIRGARASGVLEDRDVCAGKTFDWKARTAP